LAAEAFPFFAADRENRHAGANASLTASSVTVSLAIRRRGDRAPGEMGLAANRQRPANFSLL